MSPMNVAMKTEELLEPLHTGQTQLDLVSRLVTAEGSRQTYWKAFAWKITESQSLSSAEKITLPAASSFKPNHLKSSLHICERIRTTHEPTWNRSYLPCAIKPAKRMSKFHLTAGCISARVVWRPSSLSSQSNFVGSVAGTSAMMESGVSTPVPPALFCRCAASWSDPNLTSVVPPLRAQSAPLAHPYGLHTGRGKPLEQFLRTERCYLSPWMTGGEFKPKA